MRKRKAEKAWLRAFSGGCQNILKPSHILRDPIPLNMGEKEAVGGGGG